MSVAPTFTIAGVIALLRQGRRSAKACPPYSSSDLRRLGRTCASVLRHRRARCLLELLDPTPSRVVSRAPASWLAQASRQRRRLPTKQNADAGEHVEDQSSPYSLPLKLLPPARAPFVLRVYPSRLVTSRAGRAEVGGNRREHANGTVDLCRRRRRARARTGSRLSATARRDRARDHVARLERPRGTGAAGRDRDARQVERISSRLRVDPGEADVEMFGSRGAAPPLIGRPGSPSECRPRAGRAAGRRATRSAFARRPRVRAPRAMPTTPDTFSVPERRPNSCPPPTSIGAIGTPGERRERRPLWGRRICAPRAKADRRPARARRAAASWAPARRRCERARRARARCGELGDRLHRSDFVVRVHDRSEQPWTRAGRQRTPPDRRARRVDRQATVTSQPSLAQALERVQAPRDARSRSQRTCAGRPSARAAPSSARLSASVPLPVNVISLRDAPRTAATRSRASSSSARARRPSACSELGL